MPRLLFITKSPPYPPTIGGNQRSNLLLRAMSRIVRVDLLLSASGLDVTPEHEMGSYGKFNLVGTHEPVLPGGRTTALLSTLLGFRRATAIGHHAVGASWAYTCDASGKALLRELVKRNQYSLIVGCPASTVAQMGATEVCPTIVDTHDLPTEYYTSRLSSGVSGWGERLVLGRHLRQLRRAMPPIFRSCYAAFVSKAEDRYFPGLEDAVVLPNIPFVPETPSASRELEVLANDDGKTIFMLAACSHKPNSDGVDAFVRHIWPGVRQAVPDARFRVAGSGISEAQAARWSAVRGVEVVGFERNLDEAYARATITVAPVFWGAGTNIKVLESFAYGRTCVVTPFAHRGYEASLRHKESLLVGLDARGFRDACVALLQDPDMRHRLAVTGQRIVEKNYTFDRFCRIVERTLVPLLTHAG